MAISLTAEQHNVFAAASKLSRKVQTIGGFAGTGKTILVAALAQSLPSFCVCAFTGKAAQVLKERGVPATTIHSRIYNLLKDHDHKPLLKDGKPQFVLKPHLDCSGFIIDEASMIDAQLHRDLTSFELPIIFLGDHGQLEPVGEDIYLMKNPDFRLETVHRNAGEIQRFSVHVRNGGDPEFYYSSNPEVSVITKREAVQMLQDDPKCVDQIICGRNKTRVQVNAFVRQCLGFEGDLPRSGDRIISLRNRNKSLFNGTQVTVRNNFGKKLSYEQNGKLKEVAFDPSAFNAEKANIDYDRKSPHPFDYAYAITCHKSQGSEWDTVMVIAESCQYWDMARWAYTAASRARKKLLWVIPEEG